MTLFSVMLVVLLGMSSLVVADGLNTYRLTCDPDNSMQKERIVLDGDLSNSYRTLSLLVRNNNDGNMLFNGNASRVSDEHTPNGWIARFFGKWQINNGDFRDFHMNIPHKVFKRHGRFHTSAIIYTTDRFGNILKEHRGSLDCYLR